MGRLQPVLHSDLLSHQGDQLAVFGKLVIATSQPSVLSYGQLKLLPFWDALHSDPRFEKIVASLAPKDANP